MNSKNTKTKCAGCGGSTTMANSDGLCYTCRTSEFDKVTGERVFKADARVISVASVFGKREAK